MAPLTGILPPNSHKMPVLNHSIYSLIFPLKNPALLIKNIGEKVPAQSAGFFWAFGRMGKGNAGPKQKGIRERAVTCFICRL
jgi:hypothetical protein